MRVCLERVLPSLLYIKEEGRFNKERESRSSRCPSLVVGHTDLVDDVGDMENPRPTLLL